MATATATLTPDDLLELPEPEDGSQYELSDGQLILVGNALALHELIKTTVFGILTRYWLQTKSGRAFCESMFPLRSDRARIPDVAWVVEDRLAQIPRDNRAIAIAPDIAIEIISDSETSNQSEKKLRDYLEAGVEVWQMFPETLSVIIWTGNHAVRLDGAQPVTSEKLPGFSVPVSDLFA